MLVIMFTYSTLLVPQGKQGPPGPKADKVGCLLLLFFFSFKFPYHPRGSSDTFVLQGERGIGMLGPAGIVGPQGLKVSKRM